MIMATERRKADIGPPVGQRERRSGQDRRKPGRPRLVEGEDSSVVRVRMPAGLHDAACVLAIRQGVSVSSVLRIALRRLLAER